MSASQRSGLYAHEGFELNDDPLIAPEDVRVLFVEDDPSVAQMYKLKLELDGYTVEIASDGEMAAGAGAMRSAGTVTYSACPPPSPPK